jgi:hypothetical protein
MATTEPNMVFSFKIQNDCLMDSLFDLSNTDTILIKTGSRGLHQMLLANVTFIHQSNITLQFTVRPNQVLIVFLKNTSLYTMWHRPKTNTSLRSRNFLGNTFCMADIEQNTQKISDCTVQLVLQ